MQKPATGVPLILVLMAMAAALPVALANEDAPAASAAEDMPASQLTGSTAAEPLATEANAAGAPAPGTIDPIVPPVKRVIPVTPSLKALKPAAKKPADAAKKPAAPAAKAAPASTGQTTKAADNAKPGPPKPDDSKKP